MTLGAILIFAGWLYTVVRGLFQPWIVATGLFGWIVLCPPWNWRYGGLPDLEYQNYLFFAVAVGTLLTGFSSTKLGKVKPFAFLTLFLAISWVSSFGSLNPERSTFFLDTFLKITLISFFCTQIFDKSQHIKWVLFVVMLAQGWNALNINQLFYQYGINNNNFSWNFLDNNTYSISSLPILGLSLGSLFLHSNLKLRLAALLLAILQIHAIMILGSRGSMLAVVFMLGLASLIAPKDKATLTLLLFLTLVAFALAGPSVIGEFNSAFASENERDSSATSRFYLWQAGWEITKDHPLLGVGPWAGDMLVPQYGQGFLQGERKALHNIFFEASTGSGVPAAICYFLFYFLPWKKSYNIWRKEKRQLPNWMAISCFGTIVGVPAYLVGSCFSSGLLIENIYVLLSISISSSFIYEQQKLILGAQRDPKALRNIPWSVPQKLNY